MSKILPPVGPSAIFRPRHYLLDAQSAAVHTEGRSRRQETNPIHKIPIPATTIGFGLNDYIDTYACLVAKALEWKTLRAVVLIVG